MLPVYVFRLHLCVSMRIYTSIWCVFKVYINAVSLNKSFCKLLFVLNIYIYIFKLINLFYILFLAVLGLRCCARAFSSCGERGGLSPSRPLLLRSTDCRHAGSVVVAHGLSCSAACGIFPDQGSNPCPCIGRQTLNHCATREFPRRSFLRAVQNGRILYKQEGWAKEKGLFGVRTSGRRCAPRCFFSFIRYIAAASSW